MAFVGRLVSGLVRGVFGGGSKQPAAPTVPLTPTRNDALERAAAADNLARRTGTRGRRRTPAGGAEASTGARTSLLGRSS